MTWVEDVLRAFAPDDCEELWWHVRNEDDQIVFSVDCSDTFEWASADAETIDDRRDLVEIQRAKWDTKRIGEEWAWPALWCCRKRGERPMNAWYRHHKLDGELKALFDACGPPRESSWLAP